MKHELLGMTDQDIKALSPEEQTEMLSAFLSAGAISAGITLDDLQEMEAHLREWYGEGRAQTAALSLGIAITLGHLTASAYRIMIGDRELVESALDDMAKMGEPIALAFLRAKDVP